ncbi:MAG TPA: radical SAM family heme chaperone HemW [Vicinamibacterales bacterium]|jgi:oxygen-independent coproporphyrinogen-3 oxidase
MLGLYLHVPFCSAICNYCNFNRGLFDADLKARYVDALLTEIAGPSSIPESSGPDAAHTESPVVLVRSGRSAIAQSAIKQSSIPESSIAESSISNKSAINKSAIANQSAIRNPQSALDCDSLYFGGGTPSLLEPSEIARLIGACREAFNVADDVEITMEANPETVTVERLAGFREAGVNRLSFGVQSFRDEELRRLSRLHDADRARGAIAEARAAGFDNVSLDLMMWLPEQRVGDWLESVDAAIAARPDHMSLYLLEVYPNAPLRDEMARSRWSQAPDEDAETMYLTAMERLEHSGLDQYEISNVSRAGRRARHNLKYWTDGEWIGFGCGAHSTRRGVRWKNVSGTEDYVQRIGAGVSTKVDVRRLSPEERLGDALFTGLRLTDGIDLRAIADRYGIDVWRRYGAELTRFVDAGWLVHDEDCLKLTRRGMLLAHEVMTVFV